MNINDSQQACVAGTPTCPGGHGAQKRRVTGLRPQSQDSSPLVQLPLFCEAVSEPTPTVGRAPRYCWTGCTLHNSRGNIPTAVLQAWLFTVMAFGSAGAPSHQVLCASGGADFMGCSGVTGPLSFPVLHLSNTNLGTDPCAPGIEPRAKLPAGNELTIIKLLLCAKHCSQHPLPLLSLEADLSFPVSRRGTEPQRAW